MTNRPHFIIISNGGGGPRIVWAAAMSLAAPTTPNNQAEYFGLVTDLRAASCSRLRPLTVIGDSAMIVGQLRQNRPPKCPVLRRQYAQARVMADTVAVTEWRHHVLAYNKMADAAANKAACAAVASPSSRLQLYGRRSGQCRHGHQGQQPGPSSHLALRPGQHFFPSTCGLCPLARASFCCSSIVKRRLRPAIGLDKA